MKPSNRHNNCTCEMVLTCGKAEPLNDKSERRDMNAITFPRG